MLAGVATSASDGGDDWQPVEVDFSAGAWTVDHGATSLQLSIFPNLEPLIAPDSFGRPLAAGLVSAILLQAGVHMGSAVGLPPVPGVTPPFVRLRGTPLVITTVGGRLLVSSPRPPTAAGECSPR